MTLFDDSTRATTGQALTAFVSLDNMNESYSTDVTSGSDNDKEKPHEPSETGKNDANITTIDPATTTLAEVDTEVPDGGYGWVVVAGCATLTFWFGGTTYSWGVMQTALINQGLASASTLSFVGSTTIAAIAAFALINARLVRILGARTTGLLGVFFMGIGETTASFTTHSIGGLFGTESIIMGIGVSLCFMVSSVTPAQYFKKKRGLANGIVYAGGGLGGTGIAFVMDIINQKLGVEWTFRIIGLSMLATGLPMAFLIKDRKGPPPSSAWVEW
ncbi:hypothetical protein ONZ43_g7361 [Nemania bipapillata]|uniref:Uncharacterized protein n=1 Tax=Nemania bipapillata TaxID=110536 RepID=A0ACC2HRA5_9PEZI|nr:hypothetical protein ONZ43_g7361 [Nemania bipapillata]